MEYSLKYQQLVRFLLTTFIGLSISLSVNPCQAYFEGAPAYNAKYRPIYAHQGIEVYVDLSSIYIVQEDTTTLRFNVLTASCQEDTDTVSESSKPMHFLVNKSTREAWIWTTNNPKWTYLDLNRAPYGYEVSSFVAVNLCYAYLYGGFLNDAYGDAAASAGFYKGE